MSKNSSPEKLNIFSIKNVQLKEENSCIPNKLLNFKSSPKLARMLPAIPIKPSFISDTELSNRKTNSETQSQMNQSETSPDSAQRSKFFIANKKIDDLIHTDRQYDRIDMVRKPRDISYLLETKRFGQDKTATDFFNHTITRSINLLSLDNQALLLNNTLSSFKSPSRTVRNSEVLGGSPQQPKESIISPNRRKTKTQSMYQGDKSKETMDKIMENIDEAYPNEIRLINESPLSKRPRTPRKIVEASAAGYGINDYMEMDQGKIRQGLKKLKERVVIEHRSQNKNLVIPSGRKEVIELSDWLNRVLDEIYREETVKSDRIFEDVQLIYTTCLQEIIQQVTVQCSERGQLLDKIWEAYIDIFDRVIRQHNKAVVDLEKYYLDDIDEIHKMYHKRIEIITKELTTTKTQLSDANDVIQKNSDELIFLKKKVKRLSSETYSLNNRYLVANQEADLVKSENLALKKIIFDSGLHRDPKFIEYQRNFNLDFRHKSMGSSNMLENLSTVIQGTVANINSLEDEQATALSDYDEEVFRHVALDTDDLVQFAESGTQAEPEKIEMLDMEVQTDAIEEKPIQHVYYLQPEAQADNVSQSSNTELNREELSKSEVNDAEAAPVSPRIVGLDVFEEVQNIDRKDLYELLNIVGEKLSNRVADEGTHQMEADLIPIALNIVKEKMNLMPEDFKDMFDHIVGKHSMESPKQTQTNKTRQMFKSSLEGLNKLGLIHLFEDINTRLNTEALADAGDDEMGESDIEKNKIFKRIINMIKGDQTTLQKRASDERTARNQTEPHSPHPTNDIYRIDYVDIIEDNITQATDEVNFNTMTSEQKADFLRTASMRLEQDYGAHEAPVVDRELVRLTARFVKERSDLTYEEITGLLDKALIALDKSLMMITMLKVENGEYVIDVQELKEKVDKHIRHITELEKEIIWAKTKMRAKEKENDKLISKMQKMKTVNHEKKETKMRKLSVIMENIAKIQDIYKKSRASFSNIEVAKDMFEHEFSPQSKIKHSLLVPNQPLRVATKQSSIVIADHPLEIDPVGTAEKLIENVSSMLVNEGGLGDQSKDSSTDTDKIDEDDEDNATVEELDQQESPWMTQNNDNFGSEKIELVNRDSDNARKSIRNQSIFRRRSEVRTNSKKLTTIKIVDLMKQKKIAKVLSLNADSANSLLVRVRDKRNIASGLQKLTVLKFIAQIYLDRLKAVGNQREIPLYIVSYDYFMNKYGLKKVAETKCQQMFESIRFHKNNKRIARFSNLLGLGEQCDSDELEIYLSAFRLLDIKTNGILIASNLNERTPIYFEYAESAAITLFKSKIDPQGLKELVSNLSKMTSTDKSGNLMIEFEDIVDEFLCVQKAIQDKIKKHVKDIFSAADLDSDENIMLFEFDILYKHLEKQRYNKEEVRKLFFEEADLLLADGSNERVVSFDKFASICLESGLFSKDRQDAFAKAFDARVDLAIYPVLKTNQDKIQNVQDLEDNLSERLNEIRLMFMKSGTYDSQLKGIITKLYNSVRDPLKSRNTVWLTYRLLDEESKDQLLKFEIKRMLPRELFTIYKFVEECEDWTYNETNPVL